MLTIRNKILLVTILLPIVAGLFAFGMRVPDLTGISSGKPKPRPRAVIQNQIRTCKQCLEKKYQAAPLAAFVEATTHTVVLAGNSAFPVPVQSLPTATRLRHIPARASPAFA